MLTKYAALNRLRGHLRHQYTLQGEARVVPLAAAPEPETPDTPEDEVLREDRREQFHRTLARLPDADRNLLIRR